VFILKRLVHRSVQIPFNNLIRLQSLRGPRKLVKLVPEVLPLLVGALRGGRERSKLAVDLLEELAELAKVEGAGLVLVVFLEELVEALEVAYGLRKALLDLRGDVAPVGEVEFEVFGVFAVFPGEDAKEGDDVVGYVVLNGGTVADGVDITERGAVEAEVCVSFQSVPVGLDVAEPLGEALAELGLGNAGGPEAEAHGKFFSDDGAVFAFLCEDDGVGADFAHAGVDEHLNLIAGEVLLGVL
jgi:hypothetical protein